MSERSIRRATARREAAQRRREELRRRHAGLIVGAAIGASVLGVAPAQAATLTVTSKADAASNACDDDCTLRDAIAQAADGDRIVFASTVTGSIRLTAGQLGVDDSIRIDGPGAGTLSILGADNGNETLDPEDSRIVQVTGVGNEVVLAGLTLSEGGGGGGGGGAIRVAQENQLRLVDSTVTGNLSARDGGGIEAYGADLELIRSTVSGNRGLRGGGVAAVPDQSFKYDRVSNLTVEGSTISGNTAAGDADGTSTGDGGGILSGGGLRVSRSTISGNTTAEGSGGGIAQLAIRSVDVDDATIEGNKAPLGAGGGIALGGGDSAKYSAPDAGDIRGTTIARNEAQAGAGLAIGSVGGISLGVTDSTLSANVAAGAGGGVLVQPDGGDGADLDGRLAFVQSTISGNTADVGAGIAVGSPDAGAGVTEGLTLANATVAANKATTRGGGVYLSGYDTTPPTAARGVNEEVPTATTTVTSRSTVLADNTAAGQAQDVDRADGADGGGVDVAFSLVEAAEDKSLLQAAGAVNVLGKDPKLAALGDNGGSTDTQLPALDSPAVDQGDAPGGLDLDQRRRVRTVDLAAANPTGGDGTDIGAVEVEKPAEPQQPVTNTTTTTTTIESAPITIIQPPAVFTRVPARRLSVRVTPGKDVKAPFTFRTSGRLFLPPTISRKDGCGSVGVVSVRFARNENTISTRRVRLKPNCTYVSTVTFRDAKRFGSFKRLKLRVRFLGNQRLLPLTSKSKRSVRVQP